MRAILVCCGLVGCAALAQAQYVMPGGTPVGRAMIEPVGMQFPKIGKPAPPCLQNSLADDPTGDGHPPLGKMIGTGGLS